VEEAVLYMMSGAVQFGVYMLLQGLRDCNRELRLGEHYIESEEGKVLKSPVSIS
jgi:hypothetical protein